MNGPFIELVLQSEHCHRAILHLVFYFVTNNIYYYVESMHFDKHFELSNPHSTTADFWAMSQL